MGLPTLLVISKPADYLRPLEDLHFPKKIIISDDPNLLRQAAPQADVVLVTLGCGPLFQTIFPLASRLRWAHSFSAGVEAVLFPELIASAVTLTNARGVFRRPLAEFVMAAVLFFTKDVRRLLRNQQAGLWEPFDIEEVHGKTMGIFGYGETGQASARLAHAFGMKVVAARRRPELSRGDPVLDRVFAPGQRGEMIPACDFLVLATPDTPDTRRLIGQPEIESMKREAVAINVGRASIVDEAALVQALEQKRIRGAALDVFETEPLPSDHPFFRLENVLLSPHTADRTSNWQELGVQCFIKNLERFVEGEPLENVVDKTAGY